MFRAWLALTLARPWPKAQIDDQQWLHHPVNLRTIEDECRLLSFPSTTADHSFYGVLVVMAKVHSGHSLTSRMPPPSGYTPVLGMSRYEGTISLGPACAVASLVIVAASAAPA